MVLTCQLSPPKTNDRLPHHEDPGTHRQRQTCGCRDEAALGLVGEVDPLSVCARLFSAGVIDGFSIAFVRLNHELCDKFVD